MVVEAAEALGDDFADVPRIVGRSGLGEVDAAEIARGGLPPPADRAAPGHIQPPVVIHDAGRQFLRNDHLGRVVLPRRRVEDEVFHEIGRELLHGGHLPRRAVLIAEGFEHGEPLIAGDGIGPPFEHEQTAVRPEGHADGIDHVRFAEQDFHTEAFGQRVAFELGVEFTLIDHLDRKRGRLGGRLGLREFGGCRRR